MLKRIVLLNIYLMSTLSLQPVQAINEGAVQFRLCRKNCLTQKNKMGCCLNCHSLFLPSAAPKLRAKAKKQCMNLK